MAVSSREKAKGTISDNILLFQIHQMLPAVYGPADTRRAGGVPVKTSAARISDATAAARRWTVAVYLGHRGQAAPPPGPPWSSTPGAAYCAARGRTRSREG